MQIYRCQRSGPSGSLAWTQVSAEALLYPVGTKHLSKHNAIGDHYFLERADAQGGRPTWSFKSSTVTGAETDPRIHIFACKCSFHHLSLMSFIDLPVRVYLEPVLGRLAGRRASSNNGDIPDLLLQSTSHSGTGPLSSTAYIERVHKRGGVAPAAATCSRHGKVARIPYSSHYVFSAQDARPPVTAPTVPAGNPLLVGYFGEGFQHYRFNGSAWVLFNATAGLFVFPGGSLVGQHYFLTQPDAAGGRPTFELFAPASIVTGRAAQVVSAPSPQEDIPLVLLETTSSSGSK